MKQKSSLIVFLKYIKYIVVMFGVLTLLSYAIFFKFVESNFTADGFIEYPIMTAVKIMLLLIVIYWAIDAIDKIINYKEIFKKPVRISAYMKIVYIFVTAHVMIYFIAQETSYLKRFYSEDSFFENMTFLLLFLASMIFLYLSLNRRSFQEKMYFIVLFFFFFFVSMEEISWGQRIFEWSTPDLLKDLNYQKETNLHNIFNPWLEMTSQIFFIMIGSMLIYRDKICNICKNTKYLNNLNALFPSEEYFYFGFIFIFLAFIPCTMIDELLEEIFSIVVIIYAIDKLFLIGSKRASS